MAKIIVRAWLPVNMVQVPADEISAANRTPRCRCDL